MKMLNDNILIKIIEDDNKILIMNNLNKIVKAKVVETSTSLVQKNDILLTKLKESDEINYQNEKLVIIKKENVIAVVNENE